MGIVWGPRGPIIWGSLKIPLIQYANMHLFGGEKLPSKTGDANDAIEINLINLNRSGHLGRVGLEDEVVRKGPV